MIRWPWVSRTDYDAACAAIRGLEDRVVEWRTEAQCLRRDRSDLLEKYHALKLMGALIPEPARKLTPRALDPVTQAITDRAGSDQRLRAQMSREATLQRRAGMNEIEIIRAIEQGITPEEGVL